MVLFTRQATGRDTHTAMQLQEQSACTADMGAFIWPAGVGKASTTATLGLSQNSLAILKLGFLPNHTPFSCHSSPT